MASSPPQRLSAHDSVFLSWERPEQPMHVAECMVYDGHITAADIVRMIGERMHLLPRYRQKIVPAPFGIAHPTWEDDPDFDVANHVDEQTLPAPGDDRVLSRVCGELYCRLLERDRPLWHLTVLHGHAGGGTVIFLKLHHSMVDGVSSVELIEVLHATVRGTPRPAPGSPGRCRDASSGSATSSPTRWRTGSTVSGRWATSSAPVPSAHWRSGCGPWPGPPSTPARSWSGRCRRRRS